MYNFLMILGIAILVAGLYIDRKEVEAKIQTASQKEPVAKIERKSESEEVKDQVELENRLERLESLIYSESIELEDEQLQREEISQDEFLSVLEKEEEKLRIDNMDTDLEMKEKFKMIADYERGSVSLEEICQKLNMQKGEVLLLKNFYKKYQE